MCNHRISALVLAAALAAGSLAVRQAAAKNSCGPGDFVDYRGQALVTIANNDPGNPYRYRPRCALISAGTTVRFVATPGFGSHPLYGGAVENGTPTMDPASPIGSINGGTSADRVLPETGEFPFFCDYHYDMGMQGSILVVPETIFVDGFDTAP
jgi:plastocyanin